MPLYKEYCNAECHLCQMSFMLSVKNKSLMRNVIALSVVMLNVVAPWIHSLKNGKTELINGMRTAARLLSYSDWGDTKQYIFL